MSNPLDELYNALKNNPVPITTPIQPTELDKASERFCHERRNGDSLVTMKITTDDREVIETALLAAKRVQELEKVNTAYAKVIGTNAETLFSLQQELQQLHIEYKKALEALNDLKKSNIDVLLPLVNKHGPSEVWLPEQMQVSKAMQDTDIVLSTPLAIKTMKKGPNE